MCVTPLVFNLDKWLASHTSFLPPWGKSPWCPFNGRLVGPLNWPGDCWRLNYDSPNHLASILFSSSWTNMYKLYIILRLVSFVVDIIQRLNNSVSTCRILSCVSTRGSYEASTIHGRPYLHAMDLGKVYWMWPNCTVTPLLELISVQQVKLSLSFGTMSWRGTGRRWDESYTLFPLALYAGDWSALCFNCLCPPLTEICLLRCKLFSLVVVFS